VEEVIPSGPGTRRETPSAAIAETATPDVGHFGGGALAGWGPAEKGDWSSRIVWFVLFAVPLAVVITAALLTPAAAGHGTHTQLGLPPCGFLVFTGYPCPGCGLTTAFAHMVRLQLFGAWHANPFGIVLFLCTAATIPVAVAGFVRGWSVVATLDKLHAEKIAIGLSLLSLSVWIIRVAAQAIAG
jgi:hypothetical protein